MTEEIGRVKLDLTHYPGEDKYCDGEVEDVLLDIARNRSKAEYLKEIEERASWPVLYHLSPLRENIVDWIPMDGEEKVLEIGSGCGAITGALARKAKEVTCVELSKKRSLINAHRNSELDNVTIHVGNFRDIEPELPCQYDFIFLIGVFEYGLSYMGEDRPFEEFLSIIMKHVKKKTGRVVIAIENKYGLKYFAGCKEDHLGTWFSGIENYPSGGGVRTFSRKGLEKIFASCGVKKYHFYYPYPDYKFMTTLYSDSYLPGKGELSNNMRNFDRDRMLLFDEKHAFDGIVEDDLFSVFANSYEVIIGDGFDLKYAKYSNDRAPEYRIRTEICRDKDGEVIVKKHPLCEEAKEHIRGMAAAYENLCERYQGGKLAVNRCELHEEGEEVWDSFEFLGGRPLSELMDECLERDDTEGFYALFEKYCERTGYRSECPVADYDLVFGNIMVEGDEWTVIDYEWTFGKEVDPKELAFRAVYCYLMEDEKRNKLNLDFILERLGITQEDAEDYREKERDFQKFVTGQRMALTQMRDIIGCRIDRPVRWMAGIKENDLVKRVQIYEDTGSGFSEEQSYFAPEAYRNDRDVELTLAVSGNVQVLRIDPMFDACAVKLEEMTFNGEAVPTRAKKIFYTNGRAYGRGEGVVFATQDPSLYVRVAALKRQAENILHVKLTAVRLPMDVAEGLAGSAKKGRRRGGRIG